MAVKIKLMRMGKMRAPYYRIVVADARTKRDGRAIEEIGLYHPKEDPSVIKVDADRAAYWLGVGAQPTEAVAAILKVTGDWQKFKGLPAPPPMLVAPEKADKKAAFEAAHKEAAGAEDKPATTPKKKADKADKSVEGKVAEAAVADVAPEAPAAEEVGEAHPVAEAIAEAEAANDAAEATEAPAAEAAAEAPAAEAAPEAPADETPAAE